MEQKFLLIKLFAHDAKKRTTKTKAKKNLMRVVYRSIVANRIACLLDDQSIYFTGNLYSDSHIWVCSFRKIRIGIRDSTSLGLSFIKGISESTQNKNSPLR